MICKRCHAEIGDGDRFCPVCGALQPMICPECGAESRPGSKICSACGKKLPVVEREDKLVYTKRTKNTASVVGSAAIALGALLILGGAVWFLWSSVIRPDPEPETELNNPGVQEEVDLQPEKPDDPVLPEKPGTEQGDPQQGNPGQDKPEAPLTEGEQKPAPEEDPFAQEILPEEKPQEESKPEEEPTPEEEPKPEEESKPEEEPKPEPEPAASEWYFPDSSGRLLTQADIAGFNAWDLKVARNEIYARHGRIFKNPELRAYFESCSWYQGTIAPEAFNDDTMLNEIELANVKFLKAAE